MNQCRFSGDKARIIRMEKIKASESLSRHALRALLKIQSSPICKEWKKFRRAAYGLYVSKKFLPQHSITSHLVAVFWRLSGMASSFISWDEI
jgi:hypothetical protein